MTTLRDALKKKLTKKEMGIVRTAFDTIGDIAIIEIPDELKKKEKIIANTLLKLQKNIKVVCKKIGIHHGEFRTQDLKVISGEKRKETEYVENSVRLKLDVEKVYFSPRLSTERGRINGLIKEGEEVLVMFSGCGPYVFNIAKNTKAADVYGVEINPTAHKYALKNKFLNKAYNAHVMVGDVKTVVPKMYKHIIGLKSSDIKEELKNKLEENPQIIELHLFDDNLIGKKKMELEKQIKKLKSDGIEVVIHMPFHVSGRRIDLTREDASDDLKALCIMGELCKKYDIHAIIHPAIHFDEMKSKLNEGVWLYNISRLRKYFNYFNFENIPGGPFSNYEDIIKIGKKAEMKNICIDLAHFYKQYQSNAKIIKAIKEIKKNFRTYFHISDSHGTDEGLEIYKGKIDWEKILPLVNRGITEVKDNDNVRSVNMVNTFKKIKSKHKLFDRILMPLPKSAEDFLDVALIAAKKGATIHFYDFLHLNEIPDFAIKKIEKACKKAKRKFKILKYVKCGQYSPKKFRICVDFKVN